MENSPELKNYYKFQNIRRAAGHAKTANSYREQELESMLKQRRVYLLLAGMCLAALICALATARSFRPELGLPDTVGADSAYVLREKSGYVAVYRPDEPDAPVQITDIAVSELRAHDQRLLRGGLGVRDREALLMLLEDLRG